MIDILTLQPTVVSRDLKGKYVLLYGLPKSGKTTAACSFPRALLCAFEKGYNNIGGIMAQDINKWTEFKQVIRQLDKPEAKSMFDTIIIDTVTIAWDLCEKYICNQANEQRIKDIDWGQGYKDLKGEFASCLRQITMMGYGIVLIAHSENKILKDANNKEYEKVYPELPKRATEICNGLVDIIGYIGQEFDENGNSSRYLYTRETPFVYAGSRYPYLSSKIPFGYEELIKALNEAIDTQQKIQGITVVDKIEEKKTEELDFNKIMSEMKEIWVTLVTEETPDNAALILKKAEIIFGRKLKLSEITENQVDLAYLLLLELRDLMKTINN